MTATSQFTSPHGQFFQVAADGPGHAHAQKVHQLAADTCAACGGAAAWTSDPLAELGLADWKQYSCVIAPVDQGADWRYLAVGEKLIEQFKVNATGRLVSEIYDTDKANAAVSLLNNVAKPPFQPHYFRLTYSSDTMNETTTDNVFIPIKASDGSGIQVLGFAFFDD